MTVLNIIGDRPQAYWSDVYYFWAAVEIRFIPYHTSLGLWARKSLFFFFLLESRDESTTSSSRGSPEIWHQSYHNHIHYHSGVFCMLCSIYRVCCGGTAKRKPGGTLVWVRCMVLPVHLKRCQPTHLLSANQQVSFCFQTVPQRSSRIKRLQREATQPQKRRKTKSWNPDKEAEWWKD